MSFQQVNLHIHCLPPMVGIVTFCGFFKVLRCFRTMHCEVGQFSCFRLLSRLNDFFRILSVCCQFVQCCCLFLFCVHFTDGSSLSSLGKFILSLSITPDFCPG